MRERIWVCEQQSVRTSKAENDSHHAAGGAQKHAFDNELAHDAPASCADGPANRELALADRGPHQQEICQVCTRNEENENDRALEKKKRTANVAHHRVTEFSKLTMEFRVGRLRFATGGLTRRIQLCIGLRERNARLQPRHYAEEMELICAV